MTEAMDFRFVGYKPPKHLESFLKQQQQQNAYEGTEALLKW
jgi:hypothetical protein